MMENNIGKYDDMLTSILVNEKSILGFLSTIFNFLARRTDFYYIPKGPHENMGFPSGVAEELVVKVLRTCDPKNWREPDGARNSTDVNNEIMCSTIAQEVEIVADEDQNVESDKIESLAQSNELEQKSSSNSQVGNVTIKNDISQAKDPDDYTPPVIPVQKNSESYNGAQRDKYSWSQTIMELDVTVNLPNSVKSSKDLEVSINSRDVCVARRNGDIIIKDSLPYKIKSVDSFWSISEGKLLIHIEKVQERWWNKFLNSEEPIDLSKIDCSRPLEELPDDHIAKVRELQWNQEQKMKGLPTSDDLRNMEVLKKAWNAKGSPFQGKEFDPNILHQQ